MTDRPQPPTEPDKQQPARNAKSKRRTVVPKKKGAGRGPAWTFPKATLEDAIRVAKAIEDKNAGHAMRADLLARALGYNQPSDWRFLDLLRSANQYGLVKGTGAEATVSLEQIGRDVVAPSSPEQRQKALLDAFRNVEEFKKVEAHYGNKRIPEDEYFFNTLTRDFGIPRDRAETFGEIFTSNLKFLRSFNVDASAGADASTAPSKKPVRELALEDAKEPRIRQFLDTCFVMMPFGAWFDRYYQEIYVPAIKEAGLEPRRADELFSTGSVMEQIWDQISKSKILLADLTDKNPNVFYELGLAHAAQKPVVFTSARVEDVPFDLRHLRVIVYEIRDPEWGGKLRRSITDYLRNTIKDPGKSIPHPFRPKDEVNPSSIDT